MPEPERVLPHDEEMESNVLGSALQAPEIIHEIAAILSPEDFYRGHHRAIYAAMLALAARDAPTEPLAVYAELKKTGQAEDVGGLTALGEMMDAVYAPSSAAYYAGEMKRLTAKRLLIETTKRLGDNAYLPTESAEDCTASALRTLSDSAEALQRLRRPNMDDYIHLMGNDLEIVQGGEEVGESWGLRTLDSTLGPLRSPSYNILGARPSIGKTALALAVCLEMAKRGKRTMFISLETSGKQLAGRAAQYLGQVNLNALMRQEVMPEALKGEVDKAYQGLGLLAALGDKFKIIDWAYNVDEVAAEIRREAKKAEADGGLAFVTVDYLQKMQLANSRYMSRQEEVSKISNIMHYLTKEQNFPMLMLAQLNRDVENRADKRPQIQDLRESGTIEQDADEVILMYRESKYNTQCGHNRTEINLAKNKDGPLGKCELNYIPEWTKFEDLNDDWS